MLKYYYRFITIIIHRMYLNFNEKANSNLKYVSDV